MSIDSLWKIGTLVVLAVALYYRVDYIEKENVRLAAQIEEIRKDLKFTYNNLMRFQYGEYAVEP